MGLYPKPLYRADIYSNPTRCRFERRYVPAGTGTGFLPTFPEPSFSQPASLPPSIPSLFQMKRPRDSTHLLDRRWRMQSFPGLSPTPPLPPSTNPTRLLELEIFKEGNGETTPCPLRFGVADAIGALFFTSWSAGLLPRLFCGFCSFGSALSGSGPVCDPMLAFKCVLS
jgi:hypothetical protein